MQVEIKQTFFSKSQDRIVQPGEILDYSASNASEIEKLGLGETIQREEEVASTRDIPIPKQRITRKKKKITGKVVETAAVEIETT